MKGHRRLQDILVDQNSLLNAHVFLSSVVKTKLFGGIYSIASDWKSLLLKTSLHLTLLSTQKPN